MGGEQAGEVRERKWADQASAVRWYCEEGG